ncbi:MAG TPA: DUF5522 domain-containing protein [Chitinophagales bacterium]|nr:DUF5522 domain-containing protein [Chitinophagales bacterium]
MAQLKEGIDYYINEDGLFVFTETYHLKRGYCCRSGCRHCPYGYVGDNNDEQKRVKTKLNQKEDWSFDI